MDPCVIGLLVPVTSRGRDFTELESSDFFRLLFPSFIDTATWDGRRRYRIYLGFDIGDPFYDSRLMRERIQAVTARMLTKEPAVVIPVATSRTEHAPCWAWNQLARRALADGCEYFYQIGDDVVIQTSGWAIDFPGALQSNPACPGLGVTGPIDTNNTRILTQSFVSRRHLGLFGTYFPHAFKNWWSDDWITAVYEPDHHIQPATPHLVCNRGGYQRYRVDDGAHLALQREIARGRQKIEYWLAARG